MKSYNARHKRPLPKAVRGAFDAVLAVPSTIGMLAAGTVLAVAANGIAHEGSGAAVLPSDKIVDCKANPGDSSYLYFGSRSNDSVIFGSVERHQLNLTNGAKYPILGDAVELYVNGMNMQITPLRGEPEVIKFKPDTPHHTTALADGTLIAFGPSQEASTEEPRLVAAIACPQATSTVG
jgi:hypothetical protein